MKAGSASFESVEAALGHRFSDRDLLRRALTHASAPDADGGHYERLEFLGDRVLGLVIARLLYDAHGLESEGDLAKRFVALVRRETLAEIASGLGIEAHVRAQQMDGAARATLAADALEALIGALYLDGGLDAAEVFVRKHWTQRLNAIVSPPRDAKTALQEWAQARGLALPTYREIKREGPEHAPRFTIEARVGGLPPAVATDNAKRMAEQAAASLLLERIAAGDDA